MQAIKTPEALRLRGQGVDGTQGELRPSSALEVWRDYQATSSRILPAIAKPHKSRKSLSRHDGRHSSAAACRGPSGKQANRDSHPRIAPQFQALSDPTDNLVLGARCLRVARGDTEYRPHRAARPSRALGPGRWPQTEGKRGVLSLLSPSSLSVYPPIHAERVPLWNRRPDRRAAGRAPSCALCLRGLPGRAAGGRGRRAAAGCWRSAATAAGPAARNFRRVRKPCTAS